MEEDTAELWAELDLLADTLANPCVVNLSSVILKRKPELREKTPAWFVGNELKIRVKLSKRMKSLLQQLDVYGGAPSE